MIALSANQIGPVESGQSECDLETVISVMQEYVKFIFNQDDAELKKHFGSVLRAMKSKICRAKFCFEILKWPKNESMTNGQFDYTARLTDALLTGRISQKIFTAEYTI